MPNQIAGALPFSDGGANMFQGGASGLASNYAAAYRSALQMNQANYNNILSGYQTTLGNQVNAQNAIGRGYTNLSNQVLGDLHRVGTTARQSNADAYAAASGSMAQDMINRGLGNSTVQQGMQQGLLYDRTKADNSVAEQTGNLLANYRSSLGQAGLSFRERAMGANTNLQQDQLHWMNSVNSPYPNAAAYSQLAQMYGANAQADKNRAAMMAMSGGLQGGGGGGYAAQPAYGTGWQEPAWARGGGGYSGGDGGGMNGWGSASGMSAGQMGFGAPNPFAAYDAQYAAGGGGGGDQNWLGTVSANFGAGMPLAAYQQDPMF